LPNQTIEYDALYRLTQATGREHADLNANSEPEAEGYNQAQILLQGSKIMKAWRKIFFIGIFTITMPILFVISFLILFQSFCTVDNRHYYKIEDTIFTFLKTRDYCYIMPYKYEKTTIPEKDYIKTASAGAITIFIGEDSTLYIFSNFSYYRDANTIECNLISYKYKCFPFVDEIENIRTMKDTIENYTIRGYPYAYAHLKEMNIDVGNFKYECEEFKYGIRFNQIREKIGLPILQENWGYLKSHGAHQSYCSKEGYRANTWANLTKKRNIPFHYRKTVMFSENEEQIIRETNEFVGPQKVETTSEVFREKLYITYSFIKDEDYDIGWKYELSKGVESGLGGTYRENTNITKESADSILTSWGLR
jgi:hypothetical protein